MTPRRTLAFGATVLLIALVQGSVVARLPWPGSAAPHLAALFVLAVALRAGARVGAVTGFATGLLLDLLPPAAHALGQWAFILCGLGYLLGLVAADVAESRLLTVGLAAGAAALAPLAFTLFGQLLGDPRADVLGALQRLPAGALSTLLITLLIAALIRLLSTVLLAPLRRRRQAGSLPLGPVSPRIPLAVR